MTDVTITLDDTLADALTEQHGDLDTWAAAVVAQAQQDVTNTNIRAAREEADAVFVAAREKIVDEHVGFVTAVTDAKKRPLIDRTPVEVEPVEDIVPGKVVPVEDLIEP